MSRFQKYDLYGEPINPGDVCSRNYEDKVELIVYRGQSWGGSASKGEFGRFITVNGPRSIKYTNVVFAFDPMGKRRNQSQQVKDMTKQFYERNK